MPLGPSDCWKKVGQVRTKPCNSTTSCVLISDWRLKGELGLPPQGKHITAKWHQEQMHKLRGRPERRSSFQISQPRLWPEQKVTREALDLHHGLLLITTCSLLCILPWVGQPPSPCLQHLSSGCFWHLGRAG